MKEKGDASSDLPGTDRVPELEGPWVQKLESEWLREGTAERREAAAKGLAGLKAKGHSPGFKNECEEEIRLIRMGMSIFLGESLQIGIAFRVEMISLEREREPKCP